MKNANSQSYDPFSVIEGPARGDAEFTKNLWSARTSQQKPYLTTVPDEAAQATYIADQILSAATLA